MDQLRKYRCTESNVETGYAELEYGSAVIWIDDDDHSIVDVSDFEDIEVPDQDPEEVGDSAPTQQTVTKKKQKGFLRKWVRSLSGRLICKSKRNQLGLIQVGTISDFEDFDDYEAYSAEC